MFCQTLKPSDLRMNVFKHLAKLFADCLLAIVACTVLLPCLGQLFDDDNRIAIFDKPLDGT